MNLEPVVNVLIVMGVCEKFRVRENPRPKPNKNKENPKKEIKYDEMRLIHGLLRCKSGCGLWNRDRNGSSNIYKNSR